jgi:DNA modification methylase
VTDRVHILVGDCLDRLRELADESVHCVVTSPPYWALRDYGVAGQLGLERTPSEYVERIMHVFREVRRVLRRDGTCWVNLGDVYLGGRSGGIHGSTVTSQRNHHATRAALAATGGIRHRRVAGLKRKELVGLPWRVAFALQADGWFLRSDIIWHKPNPMPECVSDRPSRAHEYMFLLSRRPRYWFDADAVRTPLREKTFTAHGTPPRRSKGTDALGQVASHNVGRDVPERKPRVDENGEPVGANIRSVWRLDEIEAPDVWTIPQEPYPHSHFATFPRALVRPCVLAGCPVDGVVLDPFAGSGTTGEVALELGRRAVLIEMNPEYVPLIERRLRGVQYPLIAPGAEATP